MLGVTAVFILTTTTSDLSKSRVYSSSENQNEYTSTGKYSMSSILHKCPECAGGAEKTHVETADQMSPSPFLLQSQCEETPAWPPPTDQGVKNQVKNTSTECLMTELFIKFLSVHWLTLYYHIGDYTLTLSLLR